MQNVQYTKNQLIEEIQKVVRLWQNDKSELRNVAHLSRETGVTDSAIRRLINQGVKISDDMLFKILSYIVENEDFEMLTRKYAEYSNISAWLNRHYSFLQRAPSLQLYKQTPISEEISQNSTAYSVYMLVSTIPNVTDGYIKDQFGYRGAKELDILIQKGIVEKENGFLKVNGPQRVRFSKEQTIGLLPDIAKQFLKTDHDFNWRALEVEAVSKDGYSKLLNLFENFVVQASQTMIDHPGHIPVVVSGFVDSFTTQPFFEGEKNEKVN